MTRKFSKLVPVGIKPVPVMLASVMGLFASAISSGMSFLSEFSFALGEISTINSEGNRIYWECKKMEPFAHVNGTFRFFEIFFLCLALWAAYCFLLHFVGSKSIYTMRRLKNPLELYVRCLIIPVTFIILGIALIYLMNFMFIKIYLYYVPEDYLFPWWDENLWEVF